jgi:hypothetical protein
MSEAMLREEWGVLGWRGAMDRPKAVVVMPIWNAEATLQQALDSVFSQRGVPFAFLELMMGARMAH